jgi:PAS domain S-box-containing protein
MMTRFVTHRPRLAHLALFCIAYVLGCGFAHVFVLIPGITVSIWPPGGVFIAALIATSPYSWPWWILTSFLAEGLAQLIWFHSPPLAGFLIIAGNALGAVIGATLVNWACGRRARLETIGEVLAFVVLGAGLAPLVSATVGSATLAWFGVESQTFTSVWPLFWIGDATGILLVAPVVLFAIRYWRDRTRLSAAQWIEAGVLGLVFLTVAALSLTDDYLPTPYVILPALLWIAVRFELRGAAVGLTLLALITLALTVTGASQFVGDPESQRQRQVMLQLFLVISACSALIVAAISRQRQLALVTSRDREQELSQLVDMVPSHVWRLMPDGEPTFFNKRMVDFLGFDVADTDRPEMTRLDALVDAVHPEDAAGFGSSLRASLATGANFAMRYRLRRADGSYHWMSSRAEPVRDREGRITQWYGLCHDVEDQVQAERTLRTSQQQLQQLVDAVPAMIWCMTPEGVPSYVNKRLTDHVGVVLDELVSAGASRSLADVHPDDRNEVARALASSLEAGIPFAMKYRQRRADGSYRWTDGRAEPLRGSDGRIMQWYGVCIDIEELLATQQALRDRELELSQLIDLVPIHVWRLTPAGEPNFINKRLSDYLGLDVEEYDKPGMSRLAGAILTSTHPDDAQAATQGIAHSLATGEPYAIQWRVRRADGVYRWVDTRAEGVRDAAGIITQWYGVNVDIDDRVRAEQALERREKEFAHLVDMVPSFLWRLTADGKPNFFNRRLIEFLGFDVSDTDNSQATELTALIEAAVHPEDASAVVTGFERAFATGERFSMKYRLRRADGVYRWVDSGAEPTRDDRGNIIQWFGFSHDIDDQTRLYSDVAEREARIRRLIDSDIIGIVIWDLDGTLIDANEAFLRMVQYTREEVAAGLRWFDMTPPDWQEVHAREEAEELAETGKMQAREKEYFRKDGSRVPVLIGAACFEGQSRQGVAYILDLTELKHTEAALRDRERELSQLVDMVPSYLWRITSIGVPVFFNKRLVDFLGFDVTGLDKPHGSRLDAFIEAAIHPDDAAEVERTFERSLATGERLSMKWRMRGADGVYRWMAASAEAMRDQDGRIAQWYGLCHDIDDQLQAEEALRDSKRQLEQMIDAVPFSILSFDPSRKMTYTSKRYLEQAGSPSLEVDDFDSLARDVAHPDDFPAMFQRAQEGFAAGQPFVNRFRRRLRNGGYRWIEARAQPLRGADGAIVQWYLASIDIEDEMNAQAALRERERFLWQLVETLPAMIDCAAPDGEPIYRSQQLREFLGYQLEQLDSTGKSRLAGTLDAGVHPDDVAGVKERYAHSLATGEPYARRHRLRRFDGEYRWVETRAAPMRDAQGAIVQWNVICLDIDGEVRAQEALRLAQDRLARASQAASLAELSASIAHEVNQPLAAIVANSHACHRWLSAAPPNLTRAKVTAERIIRDANSAADVVSRIRALFRQSTESRSGASIATVIGEARDLMAEEALRRRVRIDVEVDADLPRVVIDRTQIQQVLVNLIRNGIEAMEGIEANKVLRLRAGWSADGILVEVIDGGGGLEDVNKIFDPFFTTKPNGMGMGLSICRSIVESHGGQLWAERYNPRGAKFIFTLPVDTKAAS